MRAKSTERPQGRAAPSPPPVGVKEAWGGPALPCECPQGRAAPSPPPAGVKEAWGGPALPCERGFSLPELVAVLIIVGVLAAVALPRFQGVSLVQEGAWHDEVVAALRHARQTAVSHRRLVCATVAAKSITLAIAANNPAGACGATLTGPDGSATYASSATASVSPAATLFFQPSGRVTSDGAGNTAANTTFVVTGGSTVVVVGETGHVE